jgi:hypothetical protein
MSPPRLACQFDVSAFRRETPRLGTHHARLAALQGDVHLYEGSFPFSPIAPGSTFRRARANGPGEAGAPYLEGDPHIVAIPAPDTMRARGA